jgi:hypothetical protein
LLNQQHPRYSHFHEQRNHKHSKRERERERERERIFKERFSQLFHDSINDFVWSKEITNISAARARERETEFSRREFVGIMSFNDAFYYICK